MARLAPQVNSRLGGPQKPSRQLEKREMSSFCRSSNPGGLVHKLATVPSALCQLR